MTLYHGSNREISGISLNKCRPYKDFGRGFYLTTIEQQAILMAERTSRIFSGTPWVTAFSFDEKLLETGNLSVRRFDKPEE